MNPGGTSAVFRTINESLATGKAIKLDLSGFTGTEIEDYMECGNDLSAFSDDAAAFLAYEILKNRINAIDFKFFQGSLQSFLMEVLSNAWVHGNLLRSDRPIFIKVGRNQSEPYISVYNYIAPDADEYKKTEEYRVKFRNSGLEGAGIHGDGAAEDFMKGDDMWGYKRIDQGDYTEARIAPKEGPARSEVRMGGSLAVNTEQLLESVTTQGLESVAGKLREAGKSEIQRIRGDYDKGMRVFLDEARKENDVVAFVVMTECESLLNKAFADVAQFVDLEALYGRLLSTVALPEAFAGEAAFVDAGKNFDRKRIKAENARLDEAIRNAKSPRIVLLMDRPAQDQDAEQVLGMIRQLPIEQLIVFHERGQSLGASWRVAAQGRLSPITVKERSAVFEKAQKIAKSQDSKQVTVSFWSEDYGVGDLGIYSVLAEISRVSDPELKSLAMKAVHYALLKFADLDETTRQAIISDPEKIRNYLDQTVPALAFFKFGKNGLELTIDQFVNNYLAEQSISQSA